MYISLYASTFNTKFNIQTQKGTWTTQTHTLLFRIFTECNFVDHRLCEPPVNVDFVSLRGLFLSSVLKKKLISFIYLFNFFFLTPS